jgi:hypothetical protein
MGSKGSLSGLIHNYKVWVGDDGRYEIVNGQQRSKWNAYHFNVDEQTGNPSDDYAYLYLTLTFPGAITAPSNNDTIKLMGKLASKARGHDLHVGKFAGESHQLVKQIVGTTRTIGGVFKDLRKGNLSSAARRLGVSKHTSKLRVTDIAGRWLELQYGWLPLLSDAYEAQRAFVKLTNAPRRDQIRVGTFREVTGINCSVFPAIYEATGKSTLRQSIHYEWEEVLTKERSLGLEDPIGVAWEVLPYSFVADWFIPISTYLDALNIIPQLTGRWYKEVSIVNEGTTGALNKANPNYRFYKGSYTHQKTIKYERTVGHGFKALDIPLPVLRPLVDAASPVHLKNALALLVQELLGGPRVRN